MTILSQKEYQLMIDDLKKENNKLQQRCEHLEKLHTERSNAARGITPKKEHCGYVPLRSVIYKNKYMPEYNYSYDDIMHGKFKRPGPETILAYKTTLQTPYADTMEYAHVIDIIINDFIKGIPDLDIDGINLTEKYKPYKDAKGNELNFVWKLELVSNHQKGYWETTIYTTKKVDGIPAGAEDDNEGPSGSNKKRGRSHELER